MSSEAAAFTGNIPGNYDQYLGPRIFQGFAEDIARRAASLKPTNVLELAAGTGIVSRHLRNQVPENCALTITDLNEPMLLVAAEKFNPDENLQVKVADATQLPFDDDSFDVVVCQFGVMFFPDKDRSYAEAARVLKPGGHYLLNVWDSLQDNRFAQIADRVAGDVFPDNPPGFYKVPFSYNDLGHIVSALTANGFDEANCETLQLETDLPCANDFARGLIFGNPLFEEVKSRGGDPEEVCSTLAATLKEELGGVLSLQAIMVDAVTG
jgi:ubiquinone/menaquinone biosynthesis C-methylase UbiE